MIKVEKYTVPFTCSGFLLRLFVKTVIILFLWSCFGAEAVCCLTGLVILGRNGNIQQYHFDQNNNTQEGIQTLTKECNVCQCF